MTKRQKRNVNDSDVKAQARLEEVKRKVVTTVGTANHVKSLRGHEWRMAVHALAEHVTLDELEFFLERYGEEVDWWKDRPNMHLAALDASYMQRLVEEAVERLKGG